jgi:hypothetical protein
MLWLYGLPNPYPESPITSLHMSPTEEQSVVYAVSLWWSIR